MLNINTYRAGAAVRDVVVPNRDWKMTTLEAVNHLYGPDNGDGFAPFLGMRNDATGAMAHYRFLTIVMMLQEVGPGAKLPERTPDQLTEMLVADDAFRLIDNTGTDNTADQALMRLKIPDMPFTLGFRMALSTLELILAREMPDNSMMAAYMVRVIQPAMTMSECASTMYDPAWADIYRSMLHDCLIGIREFTFSTIQRVTINSQISFFEQLVIEDR